MVQRTPGTPPTGAQAAGGAHGRSPGRDTLRMALCCGLLGAGFGAGVGWNAIGAGYELLWLPAMLAAAGVGGLSWRVFVAGRPTGGLWRGLLVGAATGAVAHYVCWYLMILGVNLCAWTTDGCRSSLGELPIDPLNGLWGAAVLTAGSLLLLGPLTVPAGALAGVLCGWWQRRP